jgi:crotonobetainyl-CoA:carnitine CoA-transferase CaiB-like acyl-CoA transferase
MAAPLKTKLFGDTKFVASPINFQGLPRKLRCETPEPGQHNVDVLNWLGYSQEQQAKLKAAGAM